MISERAFACCRSLVRVIFPLDSLLERIETEAFRETALRSFEAPDSLRHIEENAFAGCKELREMALNERLETLGEQCF